MALPIWGVYMKSVYDNPELGIFNSEFLAPETPVSIPLDCEA